MIHIIVGGKNEIRNWRRKAKKEGHPLQWMAHDLDKNNQVMLAWEEETFEKTDLTNESDSMSEKSITTEGRTELIPSTYMVSGDSGSSS